MKSLVEQYEESVRERMKVAKLKKSQTEMIERHLKSFKFYAHQIEIELPRKVK